MANKIEVTMALKGLNIVLGGLDRLKSALGGTNQVLAGLGVTASAAGFLALEKHVLENADNMGKLAQKVGIAVEQFSALAYAAKLNDVEQGELRMALKELGEMMIKDGRAGGDLAEELFKLADRFAQMPNGIEKTNLAIDKFGKVGMSMIPMLNQGADGLRRQMAEAQQYGAVISGETAAAAEAFNDQLTRIKYGAEGLALSLAEKLLPEAQRFANWIGDATISLRSHTGALESVLDGYKLLASGIAVAKFSMPWNLFGKDPFAFDKFKQRLAEIQAIGKKGPDMLPDWVKAGRSNPDYANNSQLATKQKLDEEIAQKRREIEEARIKLQELSMDRSLDPTQKRLAELEVYDQIETALDAIYKLTYKENNEGLVPLTKTLDKLNKLRVDALNLSKEGSASEKKFLDAQNADLEKKKQLMQDIWELELAMDEESERALRDAAAASAAEDRGHRENAALMYDETFTGRLSNNFRDMADYADKIGRNLADAATALTNLSLDSFSREMANAIVLTGDFDRALRNIQVTILEAVIEAMIKMAAQWVVTHVIMKGVSVAWSAFSAMMRTKDTATTIATESAKTPILATNAGLAAGSSYGASAWIGMAAFIALMGVIAAAASGAFAEGGRPDVGKIALVGEKGPELFIPDTAGTIIPNGQSMAMLSQGGGGSAAAAGGGNTKVTIIQVRSYSEAQEYLQTKAGRDEIVRIIGEEGHRI